MTIIPNIRHLRAFREVAEQKGISAAAKRVHLSQPAVTQAIAGLESKLELALFDRKTEGMFVTEPGQKFLARVQGFFSHLEEGASLSARAGSRNGAKQAANFCNNVTASQLRAFIAIKETLNFSLAARKLEISQPSVHRAARDLEKISGMPLFRASRKGVELTPQAEIFARSVKLAFSELRQGFYEIAHFKGHDSTIISVGSMPLSRTSILPDAIHGLLKHKREVQVRTVDGPYNELLKALRYGDLDVLIGALRDPAPTDDVVQEVLLNDPLALIVGPAHPLAGKDGLTLVDALKFPWIAPPKSAPAGAYLYSALGIEKLDQTPVCIVSSSLVMIRGLLARGNYITIMSLHQMELEQAQGVMVPLKLALPNSARPIGLTYRKGWKPTATQERFLDLVRESAASYHHRYT